MPGVYRWASKVRLTTADPANNRDVGQVTMLAGKKEDGDTAYTVIDEEEESFVKIKLEVIERFHADERMTEEEIIDFGIKQDEDAGWADV